jgi:excisionase family DNA binding protein
MLISPRSYTTVAVARKLGVSLQTVQRWVDAGHLKAWKTLGGHRRIDAASAEQLFQSQERAIGLQEDSSAPVAAQRPAGRAAAPAPLRVLVVEDDPAHAALLTGLVRAAVPDAHISVADNGFAALLTLGQFAPQVFVADVHLPHMDGFAMLHSLTMAGAVRPATIIAVSELPPALLAERAGLLPDVHFMSKPLDPERFIRTIAENR